MTLSSDLFLNISGCILPLLFVQITPQMLKKRSMQALDERMHRSFRASELIWGIEDWFRFQKSRVWIVDISDSLIFVIKVALPFSSFVTESCAFKTLFSLDRDRTMSPNKSSWSYVSVGAVVRSIPSPLMIKIIN